MWTDATPSLLPVTGEWTNRVEVADLNGDRLLDLVFANGGNYSQPGPPESSRIFINQGNGSSFEEITAAVFGSNTYYARTVKVRDINNDTIPDLILGTTFQTQSQLFIGAGNGAFTNVTSTHLPQLNASVGDLELGDVDLDGDLDMVLVDWGPGDNMNNAGGRTMLWLNDGNGSFRDATTAQMPDILIQFSWDVEFIDFDNDFDLDIAITCKRCGTSRIFVNDGEGVFTDKRLLPAYTNNYDFEVMDLNADGYMDLVTVNDGEIVNNTPDSRREHIFINMAGERFVDATEELWPDSENTGEDDNNVVFLDFDSDGDPDFLLSSLTGEDRLLINDGKGKFKLAQPVLKGSPTRNTLSLVVGDINNDKKLDLIMGQGEGDKGIEERIFLGDKVNPDTARPLISTIKILLKPVHAIYARVHDNKSPNMPQDWTSVEFYPDSKSKPLSMTWYGENLWRILLSEGSSPDDGRICATDYAGNMRCVSIKGQ